MNIVNVLVILALFVALLIHVVRYWLTAHQQDLAQVYRYRLFAIRDRLVALAVENKNIETDETFVFLYHTTNQILPICKPMRLQQFLRIVEARGNADTAWKEKFQRAQNHPVPEIRNITGDLISTLVDIIIYKSITVRVASKCVWLISATRRVIPHWIRANEAYRVYRQLDHLRQA